MNNRGQVVVMFVLLLPLFLICSALVIDAGLMINAKIKGSNLLTSALKYDYDVEEYFSLNKINLKNINYLEKNDEECVIIIYDIKSVFGKILGYKKYEVKVEKCE